MKQYDGFYFDVLCVVTGLCGLALAAMVWLAGLKGAV